MSVAEKLKQIAENEQRVFDAGVEKGVKTERDTVWDMIQNYGNRTDYSSAFAYVAWNDETFNPKYDIKPVGQCGALFRGTRIVDLEAALQRCGVVLDTSKATYLNNAFNSRYLEVIPAIDMTAINSESGATLNVQPEMRTIRKIICTESMPWSAACFRYASGLVNLLIEGVIGSDMNLQYSKLLSEESITSIVYALSATAEGKTLTLSETAVETAFGVEEIQLSPDEFDADYLAWHGHTVIDNGDGSLTVSSEADARGGNIFCSPDNLSEGVYEVSYLETEGETQNSLYVYIYDTERQPVSIFDLHSGDKSQITLEEGHTLELNIDLNGGGYVNNTLTPSLKRLDWESLKATKPNWNISLV